MHVQYIYATADQRGEDADKVGTDYPTPACL